MTLTQEIKEYALSLGFCKVGVTSAQAFDRGCTEARDRGGYEHWLERFEVGADPRRMFPAGKSVLVLAHDYSRCDFPPSLLPLIGRAYLGRCYLPLPGSLVHGRLQQFEAFLREKGIAFVPDQNILLMRPAAERAGVTFFGRNNFAYVEGVGSFVILYGYIVDAELEYDAPIPQPKCPPNCRACVNACPTKALYAPYRLDPTKCVSFSNWLYQGGRYGETIPRERRRDLGCHIHGCDLCQQVCPLNRPALERKNPKDDLLEAIAPELTLENLLHMPEGFYERCVHPVMYNYLKNKIYFQRNAAVAMGNSGNGAYVPHLIEELSNPNETIRLHAAWALGQLGGEAARQALLDLAQHETSPAVREEIDAALRECT